MSDFDTSFPLESLINVAAEAGAQQAARLQASGGLVAMPIGTNGTTPATDEDGNDINNWYYTVGLDHVDVEGPIIR